MYQELCVVCLVLLTFSNVSMCFLLSALRKRIDILTQEAVRVEEQLSRLRRAS